jgi:hypothetical protein
MKNNIIFHKPIFRVNEENPLTNNELVVVLVGITSSETLFFLNDSISYISSTHS